MTADDEPLRIAAADIDTLVAQAVACAPREACGLLIGRGRHVARVMAARNLDPAPARYAIDPADHFAALRSARQDGLEVLGAYHSHPSSGATPSPSDRAEAVPDFLYLIVGLVPSTAIAVWRLTDGNFNEVSLVRT